MVYGNSDHHEPEIIKLVKQKIAEGLSFKEVGKVLGMSRGQVAGIMDRHGKEADKTGLRQQKTPARLVPGSIGVIERQTNDLSRITLIATPSLGDLVPKAYSYIARDQSFGK